MREETLMTETPEKIPMIKRNIGPGGVKVDFVDPTPTTPGRQKERNKNHSPQDKIGH